MEMKQESGNPVGKLLNNQNKRYIFNPAGIYLVKVNNRNTRARCEICSKLTIKTPERCQWRRSGVFIVNFEHISHLVPFQATASILHPPRKTQS